MSWIGLTMRETESAEGGQRILDKGLDLGLQGTQVRGLNTRKGALRQLAPSQRGVLVQLGINKLMGTSENHQTTATEHQNTNRTSELRAASGNLPLTFLHSYELVQVKK